MDIAQLVNTIDYFAVIIGALTGTLFACERRLDIIGAITCGLLTGYGGGIVRDMLLQSHGFYFMQHPDLIVICITLCAFVFFFQGLFVHQEAALFFCDALSVGMFALAGASKAYASDAGVVLAIILGGITAVGGGALRDIAVGVVPSIFKESNFYAVAGIGGAAAYVVTRVFDIPVGVCSFACVVVVMSLRYWSVCFDWKTAESQDFTPLIRARTKAIYKKARAHFRPQDCTIEKPKDKTSFKEQISARSGLDNRK